MWSGRRAATLAPPVGSAASHASSSSGRYRTSDPTFMNCGPRLSILHRRRDATLTCNCLATSSSVKSVLILLSPLGAPRRKPERRQKITSLHVGSSFSERLVIVAQLSPAWVPPLRVDQPPTNK